MLEPKGIRERIDRKLVRSIIGAKRKLGRGIIKWSSELADQLYKPVWKKFKKRRVLVSDTDATWTADLLDMQSFSKSNKGFKYILMIIDVFCKYGWSILMKTKTGSEVTKSFRDLWKAQKPSKKLCTDKGKEFYNKSTKELLEKNNVQLYPTEDEERSSVVDRWNRTIKRNTRK